MKKDLRLNLFGAFVFVSVLGTFLHFLYDITGGFILAAPFSAVNESTWEHTKLLYFPMLLVTLFQRRYFPDNKSYYCIKLLGILTGLISIPVLFYTLGGVFGKTPDIVNILIFFVSAAVGFYTEYRLLKKDSPPCRFPRTAFILILLIGLLFILFTFLTPEIPLFLDPLTNTYGI